MTASTLKTVRLKRHGVREHTLDTLVTKKKNMSLWNKDILTGVLEAAYDNIVRRGSRSEDRNADYSIYIANGLHSHIASLTIARHHHTVLSVSQ